MGLIIDSTEYLGDIRQYCIYSVSAQTVLPEYASVIFVYSNFVGTAYYDTRVCKHPSGTDQFADDRRYFDFFVSVILYEFVGYDVVPKGSWQGKYPHNRIVFSIVFDSWTDDGTIYCMVSSGLLLGCKKRLEKDNRKQKMARDTFVLAENIGKQGFVAALAILILVFAARVVAIRVYNYCEQGLFVDTASGKAMSFANVLYVADRADGEVIQEEALRELFYEMYDAADADQMNYKYAPSGMLQKAAYHEKCHDELNFTYFGEPAKRYVGETRGIYTDRYQELMIAVDGVAVQLSSALMPQVLGRYIQNYITVITLGFIRTVAYEHPLLAWYALLIYIVAVVLTIVLWKKDHESMAAAFMAVMLVTIVGNVCATALMIQCISRYMIYNLPLFYMAGFLELLELFGVKSRKAS